MNSKQFCLKWNNFQSNILNAFVSLQNTEDLTDVTLTCEGINVKAHKFILSACSPYFRTVFKENPCSHPIIILKDVFYSDLIAIINFMYHGEVLVSEEQLSSFLQTAKLLQVSGLNNTNENFTKKSSKKFKTQKVESPETPFKRAKLNTKHKVPKVINSENSESSLPKDTAEENVIDDSEDDSFSAADINENVEVIVSEKADQQSSILEAALEKPESILERSLMSHPISGKSPSSLPLVPEPTNILQLLPEGPKSVFIPRKPPEIDAAEKRTVKSTSSGSCSPSTFDRSEFLHHAIKIEEEEQYEQDNEGNSQKLLEAQPHHSSQCGNCPHCGKVYSNQSALKYHVRLVHSDLTNMYCCHLCPEAFSYREGYKKHMVEVHCIRN